MDCFFALHWATKFSQPFLGKIETASFWLVYFFMNDIDASFVNLQTVSTECEVMYDWFYIYLVHGVANMEIGLLLCRMSVHGFDLEDLDSFTNNFTWPAQFRGGAPRDVFSSRNGDGPLKCSGSETLNARTALRVYILLFVWETAGLDLKKCCVSFLKLCSVLDRLQSIARGVTVRHLELEQCIVQHLESFKDAHGTASWIPRCHMALHLGPMLKHHNMLLSCWTHERKHKLCKNFANNRLDTSKHWELPLLQDVFASRVEAFEHTCKYASVPRLSGRTKASVKENEAECSRTTGNYRGCVLCHGSCAQQPLHGLKKGRCASRGWGLESGCWSMEPFPNRWPHIFCD